jgi:hypothetical protein
MVREQDIVESADDSDAAVVDFLVPPPRPRWRSTLIAVVCVLLAVGLVAGGKTGLFSAHLEATASQWGRDPATRHVYVVMSLENRGQFPLQLRHIDATGPGLVLESMHLDRSGATDARLPLTLHAGQELGVRVDYRLVDCGRIDRNRRLAVTARPLLPVSRRTLVKVGDFRQQHEDGITYYVNGHDPYALGYQAGITEDLCHRAS